MEKPVGEDQSGAPTIHSSEPVAGGTEQPRNPSYMDVLRGKHEEEFMQHPLKKPYESFEHSRKNLTPPAELPPLPVGEDQTQPGGSLGEETKSLSWFEQSPETNYVVEIPERINNEISEHENESVDEGLEDQIALFKTNLIERIPRATPIEVKVPPESEFDLREIAQLLEWDLRCVFREFIRKFFLREVGKAGKGGLKLVDKKIVIALRIVPRFKDIYFKYHNRKYKYQHAIHKHDFWTTVRVICFLILAKPSQLDFDSMDYRNQHLFPDFKNGSYEYDFYSKIRGGDGDKWLKVLEETAKKLGELEWQYFKLCELIAQVNHEAHPVIMLEKLLPYINP